MSFELFDDTFSLLPAYTKPLSDELFSSWIARLAQDHYLKIHSFTKSLWESNNIWNRDLDRFVSDEMLMIIAAKANSNLTELKNSTLLFYEGKLFQKHTSLTNCNWIMPLGIYHRNRLGNGLMFCPSCLKKDKQKPYFRKKWRLALSVICTECQTMLQDKCPKCYSSINFHRLELGKKLMFPDMPLSYCWKCNFNLAKTKSIKANNDLVKMQESINEILKYGLNKEVIYPHLYFEVLRKFVSILSSNRAACIKIQRIVCSYHRIEYKARKGYVKGRFEVLGVRERAEIIFMAYWILEEWPERFINIFKNQKIYSSEFFREMSDIPFWYYKVVLENFYVSNANRKFLKL